MGLYETREGKSTRERPIVFCEALRVWETCEEVENPSQELLRVKKKPGAMVEPPKAPGNLADP
jgi:hypothetical protein